jgi:LmbE family N-acetylglucosaminyl deacetylase
VFVHAHPDDECILTGATLAKAASLGIRTIVVYGSRGDAGRTNADLAGETLGDRRVREAIAACAALGVSRVEWLPYADSGMADSPTTQHPNAFSQQEPERVASELAEMLEGEDVLAVVGYDANGTYGHPDHVQVHHVAHAAAKTLDADWVLDATYNREYLAGLPGSDGSLDPNFAAAEADLTHFVTGEMWLQAKVAAVANHLSQIPDDWDRENPDIEGFRSRFGTEWYIAIPCDVAADFGMLHPLFEATRPSLQRR